MSNIVTSGKFVDKLIPGDLIIGKWRNSDKNNALFFVLSIEEKKSLRYTILFLTSTGKLVSSEFSNLKNFVTLQT